jgi:hypothetical protein
MDLSTTATALIMAIGLIYLSKFVTAHGFWVSSTKEVQLIDFDLAKHEASLKRHVKRLRDALNSTLPDSIILPQTTTAFGQAVGAYWAQQECEVFPACVLQPRNAQDLATGVEILNRHFDELRRVGNGGDEGLGVEGLFAIRSGGHHHVAGAASIKGGVLIDLSLLDKITIAEDGKTVTFGAGLRWTQVFKELDKRGLAGVGGRNSNVGVGGFILGGKHIVTRHLCSKGISNCFRWLFLLLLTVRLRLFQHIQLRGRACLWQGRHCIRIF